jgi:hypothetical protein
MNIPNLIPFSSSWDGHQVAALMITILGVAARGPQNLDTKGWNLQRAGLLSDNLQTFAPTSANLT